MAARSTTRRVPTVAQVVPGAAVHIILKQDQSTGRTVHGTVQNVLTRGNHPCGIKVRLTDGRIGRVQLLGDPNMASSVETSGRELVAATGGRFTHVRDVRLDGVVIPGSNGDDVPQPAIGLDAYIRPARLKKQKHGKKGSGAGQEGTEGSTPALAGAAADADGDAPELASSPNHASPSAAPRTVACPVCGAFEGDEEAVSHHVASHFDT